MSLEVDAVLLTHGAGSGADHPSLLALEATLAPLPVVRMEFPYRREGRKAPDRAPKLLAALAEELEALCEQVGTSSDRVLLGGRSMGGRMCSMLVAEGVPAAGLALVSYPLHPPGKPDRLRTDHLPRVTCPTLFVSGTRDPFGTPEEFAAAHALVAGPVTVEWIEGGRHELKGADEQVAAVVADWVNRAGSAAPR